MPSSVILGMRYVPGTRMLVIVYRGGRGAYRYFDVPMEEWLAFRTSGSKGTYLNEVFKAKNYQYEKVAGIQGSRPLVVQDEQRDGNENDQAKQEAEFLEWGETWAFPKPRAQRSDTYDRQ
jgi:KTSC domain